MKDFERKRFSFLKFIILLFFVLCFVNLANSKAQGDKIVEEDVKADISLMPDVDGLIRLGEKEYSREKYNAALGYFKNGQEVMEIQDKKNTPLYVKLLNAIGNIYFSNKQYGLAKINYENGEKILKSLNLLDSKIAAINLFNYSNILYLLPGYELALVNYIKSIKILEKENYLNSDIYLRVLLNLSNVLVKLGKSQDALKNYENIIEACKVLELKKTEIYASSLHNKAVILSLQNNKKEARRFFRKAYKTFRRIREKVKASDSKKYRLIIREAPCINPFGVPAVSSLGLTEEETDLLRTYTGKFRFHRSKPSIQRTYKGRLADTNILLRDLLDHTKIDSGGLNTLRKQIITNKMNREGKGIYFVDIGPAVGNKFYPAATSVAVARDFTEMDVIAFDLPYAVKLYQRKTLRSAKRKLTSYKNIQIFAGDGLKSLRDQFQDKEKWLLKDRGIPNTKDSDLIVLRSANAIDIYIPWKRVKPSLELVARDFRDQPVLYLFNRSMLLKPKNSLHFKIIGLLSIRGFHHNEQSFKRHGQKPYVLNTAVLNSIKF